MLRRITLAAALAALVAALVGCTGAVAPTTVLTPAPSREATQAPTAPAVVEVTGSTGTCVADGEDTVCDNGTASDERVAGTARYPDTDCEMTVDGDATVATCSFPITLTNAGGTWEGTMEGTSTWSRAAPAHVHVMDGTYLGTGAYEGLRFVQHLEGLDYPWAWTGRIEPAG